MNLNMNSYRWRWTVRLYSLHNYFSQWTKELSVFFGLYFRWSQTAQLLVLLVVIFVLSLSAVFATVIVYTVINFLLTFWILVYMT